MNSEVKTEVVKTSKLYLELDAEEISDIIVLLNRARQLSNTHAMTHPPLERTQEYINAFLEAEQKLDETYN